VVQLSNPDTAATSSLLSQTEMLLLILVPRKQSLIFVRRQNPIRQYRCLLLALLTTLDLRKKK
jgi:hypothetical protein